jgi:hypothetical protein
VPLERAGVVVAGAGEFEAKLPVGEVCGEGAGGACQGVLRPEGGGGEDPEQEIRHAPKGTTKRAGRGYRSGQGG